MTLTFFDALTQPEPSGPPAATPPPPARLPPRAAESWPLHGEERRKHERAPLDLVVFTYPAGEAERAASSAESRDVSPAGMFIATDRPLRKGEVIFLEAFPPDTDEPSIRSRAVVRWTRRWLHPRGMGVELLEMDAADRRRLMRWMGQSAGEAEA